jgi:hypothetical protein
MTSSWQQSHAPTHFWSSGQWSVEVRDDEIADIRFDSHIVLRSVRCLIRDKDWNTPNLDVIKIEQSKDELELHLESSGFDAHFQGVVTVSVLENVAVFQVVITSQSDFMANRVGLNILHPPSLSGHRLAVGHKNGSFDRIVFPEEISPNQPALDISSLAWSSNGLGVELSFSGDVFEMEDQRNWTDASYKTYSRPLSLPFPFEIGAGKTIRQELKILITEDGTESNPEPDSTTNLLQLHAVAEFPAIGLGASSAPDTELRKLGRLIGNDEPLTELLLLEINLETMNWQAALERAGENCLELDLRVHCRTGVTASDLAELVGAIKLLNISRIAIYDNLLHVSTSEATSSLRQALDAQSVEAPIVGGARSHFTELNRNHGLLPSEIQAVTFSITPMFHALSTEQLVESLAMQRLVTNQAVQIAAGKPVHVGPITLRPRFNNVSTDEPQLPAVRDLSLGYGPQWQSSDDNRQDSQELAAWTIASAAATAVFGVASITFFEQWGPKGIETAAGKPFPVKEAIAALKGLQGGQLLSGLSPDGLIWAIGSKSKNSTQILFANMRSQEAEITVELEGSLNRVQVAELSWKKLDFSKD